MIAAAEAMPRMKAGSRNWAKWAHGFTEKAVNWMGGLQPHQIAGSSTHRVAIQNPGTESPRMAMLRMRKSARVSWRIAASTPIGTAMTIAKNRASTPSSRLMGRRRASSSSTGRLVQSDSPRSPRATWPSHSTYWMYIGRFRPSLARRSSRSLP